MLLLAYQAPFHYERIIQEDRLVEWLTVTLFLAAAFFRFRSAWPGRRVLDLLIAAFCLFVAGEEFSWGQRLVGFTPPAVFLEHNTQQEFTLHNFAQFFGKPKGILTAALLGYAFLARFARATPPPKAMVPWFVIAAALLIWYPVDFTGEWVEALAASAFLVSARPPARALKFSLVAALGVAGLLTFWSAYQVRGSPLAVECARAEVQSLAHQIAGSASTTRLREREGAVHKRLWTAAQDGYVRDLEPGTCGKGSRYLVDPWGNAYWLRYAPATRTVTVYSMGPNRRRDAVTSTASTGDDIIARTNLRD